MNNPPPQQPPWQPQEKLELLTEVIRRSRVPPEALVQFIQSNHIVPDWGNMLLPPRRSLNQCSAIYDEMMRSGGPSLIRSTSVREFGGPLSGVKRPFNTEMATYGGRMIQPRPEGAPISTLSEPSEPPRKKRGRPTKAEAEERRQAAIARGDPYPAPRRGSTMGALTAAPPAATVRPPSVAAAQAALGMGPRAPPRTPPPPSEPPSSTSSSGKRRRSRAARAEEESRGAQEGFVAARPPGPSRYPDILSRDDPPDPQASRPKSATTQPGGLDLPPR